MDPTIAFFRSLGGHTLCCEAVAMWLESRGVFVPYQRRAMMALWRDGVRAGAQRAAKDLGFRTVAASETQPGDVVLIAQADGSEIMGVRCEGGLSVARSGALLITSDTPLTAWRR